MRGLLRSLLLRSRVDRELNEELRSHIARYVDDLVAKGVSRDDAERRARAEFGGIDAVKESCRDAAGLRWIGGLRRDFWYALRLLRKTPGISATAILTLALCIGANTAIFSVVDAVLLRPLPYPEPDRLGDIIVTRRGDGVQYDMTNHSGHVWEVLRDQATDFDVASFSGGRGVNLFATGVAEHVQQQRVSANFFRVLGVTPAIGREFEADEDRPRGPAVAILSYELWQRTFGGDPSIIGRGIALKGQPHTVVGVMPAGLRTTAAADLWTPLRPSKDGEGGGANYSIFARLKPGVTWAEAESQARVIGAGAVSALQSSAGKNAELRIVSLQQGLTQHLRTPLLMLWGAVGLVLLIGCINIASLLLARSAERKREIATRMALGGGAAVLVRQLLAESLLLAMAGGAIGAALGYAGVRVLRVTLAASLGIWQTISLDERVLAATFLMSLLTSLLFGVLPAMEATRVDIRTALTESDARTVAGRRNHWPRRFLVAGEVALSMVLLVGAALLLRTFSNLTGLRPGFDPNNLVTAKISLDDARYGTTENVARLFEESVRRIRAIPGVEKAAVALTLPYERALNIGFMRADGPEAGPQGQPMNACYISGDYFEALRIPLMRGRLFDSRDRIDSAKVVLVNEAFAKRFLSKQEPVGSHIKFSNFEWEIVGIVGDVQQKAGWGNFGPLAAVPQAFIPAAQMESRALRLFHTWFPPAWIVRTNGAQSTVTAAMQQAIQSIDPQLPFTGFQPMQAVRSKSIAQQRFQAGIVAVMAGLALVLAALGIYSLVAHAVTERTREIGIRMALGATAKQSMLAVAMPALALAAVGVIMGVLLSRAAAGLLQKVLWGVSATDALTIVGVGAGLLLVAAMASCVPAIRLIRLNPADTLRHE